MINRRHARTVRVLVAIGVALNAVAFSEGARARTNDLEVVRTGSQDAPQRFVRRLKEGPRWPDDTSADASSRSDTSTEAAPSSETLAGRVLSVSKISSTASTLTPTRSRFPHPPVSTPLLTSSAATSPGSQSNPSIDDNQDHTRAPSPSGWTIVPTNDPSNWPEPTVPSQSPSSAPGALPWSAHLPSKPAHPAPFPIHQPAMPPNQEPSTAPTTKPKPTDPSIPTQIPSSSPPQGASDPAHEWPQPGRLPSLPDHPPTTAPAHSRPGSPTRVPTNTPQATSIPPTAAITFQPGWAPPSKGQTSTPTPSNATEIPRADQPSEENWNWESPAPPSHSLNSPPNAPSSSTSSPSPSNDPQAGQASTPMSTADPVSTNMPPPAPAISSPVPKPTSPPPPRSQPTTTPMPEFSPRSGLPIDSSSEVRGMDTATSAPATQETPHDTQDSARQYRRGDEVFTVKEEGDSSRDSGGTVKYIMTPAQSPLRVVGGNEVETSATRMSLVAGGDVYAFLRHFVSICAAFSLTLLSIFSLVTALDPCMTSSRWVVMEYSNPIELITFVSYIQNVASLSHLVVRGTPYFLLQFTDTLSWTVLVPFYGWTANGKARQRRLADVVYLDGVLAFADRVGIRESKLLIYCVTVVTIAGAVLSTCIVCVMLSEKFRSRALSNKPEQSHRERYDASVSSNTRPAVNTTIACAMLSRHRLAALSLWGIVVLVWFIALYPVTLMAVYELDMEARAESSLRSWFF